jgi:nucleoside-diphosphate-sugar epimerase
MTVQSGETAYSNPDISRDEPILVTGAGGFIGGALIADLRRQGFRNLRAVDCKPFEEWYQRFGDVDSQQLDLRSLDACVTACDGMGHVYNLAADMGGMGFIETHKAECMLTVLINTHMLMAARDAGIRRFFYSSSACVYTAEKQTTADVVALREADAYPAQPEDGYGWEKLFSERMCRHFTEDFGIVTRGSRKGAGGNLPEGDRREAVGQARHRNLGRWRADA